LTIALVNHPSPDVSITLSQLKIRNFFVLWRDLSGSPSINFYLMWNVFHQRTSPSAIWGHGPLQSRRSSAREQFFPSITPTCNILVSFRENVLGLDITSSRCLESASCRYILWITPDVSRAPQMVRSSIVCHQTFQSPE
jgi:hypothetical protein